jgi:hypothetical protein
MSKRLLMLFSTTHDVIKAERVCLKLKLSVQVVPVPRSISSECGMALEVTARVRRRVTAAIESAGVAVKQTLEAPDGV